MNDSNKLHMSASTDGSKRYCGKAERESFLFLPCTDALSSAPKLRTFRSDEDYPRAPLQHRPLLTRTPANIHTHVLG